MTTKDNLPELNADSNLLPSAATGAMLLRFILATWWIAHWWYKVGFEGMPATESFFIREGLPAWLAGMVRYQFRSARNRMPDSWSVRPAHLPDQPAYFVRLHDYFREERILFSVGRH